jgi:hypothetical protein
MSTQTFSQATSIYDPASGYAQSSIFSAQITVSAPNPDGLLTGTNLLVPDRQVARRLDHFFEELYDLRPQSHLTRFLKALLGDSGMGQLRKRTLLYRLQSAMTSTHFYDLDSFYGALFSAHRNPEEGLEANPLTSNLTSDEWDTQHAADTRYRERVMHLARAIPLGATVAGIKTAAEAIFGCECDVYEIWRLLDGQGNFIPPIFGGRSYDDLTHDYGVWGAMELIPYDTLSARPGATPAGSTRTWTQVEALYPHWSNLEGHAWSDIAAAPTDSDGRVIRDWTRVHDDFPTFADAEHHSWFQIMYPDESQAFIGRTGSRAEFIVKPYKQAEISTRQRAAEEWSAIRVLQVLKPAGTLATIDLSGVEINNPIPFAAVAADSTFWDVEAKVTPKVSISSNVYPTSPLDPTPPTQPHVVPRPVFSESQGATVSYSPEIVAVKTYAEGPDEAVLLGQDYEVVTYYDGQQVAYSGERALLTPRQVLASRFANDGVLLVSPYGQNRVVSVSHS